MTNKTPFGNTLNTLQGVKGTSKMCRCLKKYDETGGMETTGIKSEDCISCYDNKSGVDIFCPDYKSQWFMPEIDYHEEMHRRGYK